MEPPLDAPFLQPECLLPWRPRSLHRLFRAGAGQYGKKFGLDTQVLNARRRLAVAVPVIHWVPGNRTDDAIIRGNKSSADWCSPFGFLGAAGALLVAIDVFGPLAYTAAHQTKEIGIRAALGSHHGGTRRRVRPGPRPKASNPLFSE